MIVLERLILNGNNYESIEQLHKELKEKLELPDYYGENLNALWDCLTAWVDLPLTIEIHSIDSFKSKLGNDASEFIQLLEDAVEEIEGFELEITLCTEKALSQLKFIGILDINKED